MKRPAWVRVKVEQRLRRQFKKVARKRGQYPAEMIRGYMQRCVDEAPKVPADGADGSQHDV